MFVDVVEAAGGEYDAEGGLEVVGAVVGVVIAGDTGDCLGRG